MLAEINLLPKKDIKNQAKIILFLIIMIVLLTAIIIFYFQSRSIHQKEEEMIESRTGLEQQLQQAYEGSESMNKMRSIQTLQNAISYADEISTDIIPVLEEMTELLPERGFIIEFKQENSGKITVIIQFDVNRDTAYYLARLKESPSFKNVSLQKIEAKEVNAESNNIAGDHISRIEATYEIHVNRSETGGDERNENSAE
ncbi:PilN domain-containing protein [Metabacillus fastidiosus]|uniref:PilN domain-containing protein n=1 Tax=Metabacillus fastidiosus TaxID=1458 RepID=A0ABU6NVC8_9BACI|nr:PilN domain-containing protein [Metabacillus fastidiosus]MED4401092.1 PilN domain-containing protein [Metabacillus fastidiosus]MED4464019.1 PilN domain-containing protein [Metabacillus fastidiosus]